jgi:uncharacterized membrane protein
MSILLVVVKVIGFIYILFVPGFAWSFVFFARSEMNWVERIALSAAMSIGLMTLSIFWLNWVFNVKITEISVGLVAVVLPLIALVIVAMRKPDFRSRLRNRLRSSLGTTADKDGRRGD